MNFLWNKFIQWFDRISSFFMGRIWARVIWVFGGVSVYDTFNLDRSLAEWMLPRIRLYRKVDVCSPTYSIPPGLTHEEWQAILCGIEVLMEEKLNDRWNYGTIEFGKQKELFMKHFDNLWW